MPGSSSFQHRYTSSPRNSVGKSTRPLSRSLTRQPVWWIDSTTDLSRSSVSSRRVRTARARSRSTIMPPYIMTFWLSASMDSSASWHFALSSTASCISLLTSGNRLSASGRVKRWLIFETRGRSDAGHLHRHGAAARSVELGQDDALPGSQQHGGIPHLQAHALSHEHAAKVRVGVLPLAVGILRIVVTPALIPAHHFLEQGSDVVQQRILPFVNEHGCGGVQRLQMHNAVADAALAHDLIDAVRNVDELQALAGDPVRDAAEDFESARSSASRSILRRRFDFRCLIHLRSLMTGGLKRPSRFHPRNW